MNTNPSQLADQLTASHQRMTALLSPLPDDAFFAPKAGKWSAAETRQHLYLSARMLPGLLTGSRSRFDQWPRSGRSSRSFDTIAALYADALRRSPLKAPATVVARPEDLAVDKTTLLNRFTTTHTALVESVAGWAAGELDTHQLPHPVLGLLTVGEMLHFTAYHIDRHRTIEAALLT